jgi:L-rhamnose mutarotase
MIRHGQLIGLQAGKLEEYNWAIMKPMQKPLPTRGSGEWWAEMEEVFHLE